MEFAITNKNMIDQKITQQKKGTKESLKSNFKKLEFKNWQVVIFYGCFFISFSMFLVLVQEACVLHLWWRMNAKLAIALAFLPQPNSTQSWVALVFLRNHTTTEPQNQTIHHFFSAPTQPNSTKFSMQPYFNPIRRFMQKKIPNFQNLILNQF